MKTFFLTIKNIIPLPRCPEWQAGPSLPADFLNAEGRSQGKTPEVIQRIFTDRLSRTLLQLMAIEGVSGSFQLDQKILSSLDFLASMVIREKQIYHFYDMKNGRWETSGGLEDLALLSVVFAEAAKKYRKPHYLHALKKLHQLAVWVKCMSHVALFI